VKNNNFYDVLNINYSYFWKMVVKKIWFLFLIFQNYNCKTVSKSYDIEAEINIRYIENYGSICCPRDYKFDNHLVKYIKAFEYENNVTLKSNFKLLLGKEGEAAYFLSLENLSEELRNTFVNHRLNMLMVDDKSVINYLKTPVSIQEALKPWENKTTTNLIKL